MVELNIIDLLSGIRFESYKSFSHDEQYLLSLGQNITLIIGRNNSGKSSLVDVIEAVIKEATTRRLPENMLDVCASFILDEEHIKSGFSETTTNSIIYGNEYNFAKQFLNKRITFELTGKGYDPSKEQIDNTVYLGWGKGNNTTAAIDNWRNIGNRYAREMQKAAFRRVNSERDIEPEAENDNETVAYNGTGATNLVRKFINTDRYDESIVENIILNELNKIMSPDASFSGIRIQQVGSKTDNGYLWEIFLEENGHRYALSKSGSGLKTILLILINLYLLPATKEYQYKNICFAFEEIENNLHPALQRRVFEYLYNYATQTNTKIIITSHSHIAINMFYDKGRAVIYHVIKEHGVSELLHISSGSERGQILDDLDAKASDLFQSNGIIWVEGPSDRIYILKWLEVFSEFKFIEGQHFQFMYYGGKLLSHYEAEEQEKKTDGFINILTTNRHAALIMDSDKRAKQTPINNTKKRVYDEMQAKGHFCWITKGKEIENYISADAVNETYGSELEQIGQYDLFPDYISKYDKNFSSHKPDAARKICEHITAQNSEGILDLKQNIEKLYSEIMKWN